VIPDYLESMLVALHLGRWSLATVAGRIAGVLTIVGLILWLVAGLSAWFFVVPLIPSAIAMLAWDHRTAKREQRQRLAASGIEPGPAGRRFAAFLIDYLVVIVLLIPLLVAAEAIGISPGQENFDPILWLALGLVFWTAVLGLFAYFDGSDAGATPGKRLMKLRVADQRTLAPIGFLRAVLRRLVWVIGIVPLYLGWLWALLDERRQGWHDKAARDVVIRAG
jgi:uncharacterized RDD family membrane protein YckC